MQFIKLRVTKGTLNTENGFILINKKTTNNPFRSIIQAYYSNDNRRQYVNMLCIS